MKRLLFFAGFSSLLLTPSVASMASSASSSSAPSTMYERIKNEVEEQYKGEKVEPEIAMFIHLYMDSIDQDVTVDDVTSAEENQLWELCGRRPASDPNKSFEGCDALAPRIRRMVKNEERVRNLGRALQLIATSQERPISDLPNRSLQFSKSMRGIVSIWQAGTGSVKTTTGSMIRTRAIDQATMEPLLQQLATELNELDDEQKIAAVWRYQYGVRLVRSDRSPAYEPPYDDGQSGPGTERQYLFKRWDGSDGGPNIEEKLTDIWDNIELDTFTPPLAPGESVLYVFPKDLLKDILPDNVIVWARMDGPVDHPLGDVGLQWQLPLDPVLPSLVDDQDPILGGNYPPDPQEDDGSGNMQPIDGNGLCSDPTQQRGYLCRTFTAQGSDYRCPDDPDNPVEPEKINLITCTNTGSVRATIAGPDVCRDINYRLNNTFDPNTQCKIDVRCEPSCAPGAAAVTKGKDPNGLIKICVDEHPPGGATYLLFHELHHAYQLCAQPPATDVDNFYDGMTTPEEKNRACCQGEGEAYRAACDMMEQDGVFEGAADFDGIPINAETCAEAFTDAACLSDTGLGCYTSRDYPAGFRDELLIDISNNPQNVPASCTDTIDPKKKDVRIRDLESAIQKRRDVCAPGQVEVFNNRIGNNLCYIGQCVEESLETHRMVGAQSPATVGDQAYPWDDPTTGVPLGNALINPPITPGYLPPYQLLLIVKKMEQEICQLAGLPPLSPSILCTYNQADRTEHPIADPIENAQHMLTNAQEQENATDQRLSLSLSLGIRIGTTMYADYLHNASRSLADILTMAVRLFKEMMSLDFPLQMCPTDETLPPPASSAGTAP